MGIKQHQYTFYFSEVNAIIFKLTLSLIFTYQVCYIYQVCSKEPLT